MDTRSQNCVLTTFAVFSLVSTKISNEDKSWPCCTQNRIVSIVKSKLVSFEKSDFRHGNRSDLRTVKLFTSLLYVNCHQMEEFRKRISSHISDWNQISVSWEFVSCQCLGQSFQPFFSSIFLCLDRIFLCFFTLILWTTIYRDRSNMFSMIAGLADTTLYSAGH